MKQAQTLLLTLWLYPTLHRLSYREVLSAASRRDFLFSPCESSPRFLRLFRGLSRAQGFLLPSLRPSRCRVHRLDLELLQRLIEAAGQLLLQQQRLRWKRRIADGTGFGSGPKSLLKWLRGSQLRRLNSHGRLATLWWMRKGRV